MKKEKSFLLRSRKTINHRQNSPGKQKAVLIRVIMIGS
jgi:hypothetical protein